MASVVTPTYSASPTKMHFYEPSNGHGLKHDPFNAIVGPRPIGWISTRSGAKKKAAADAAATTEDTSEKEKPSVFNLAPYSFFNAFNYSPPIIGFSSIGRKDTITNIEANGEFCWNLATLPLAEQMNKSCAFVAPEVDEFLLAGLTPVESRIVDVPRVKESPVSFECKVTDIIQLKGADGVVCDSWMVLGEVVAVHIAEHLISDDKVYDTALAQPILRGGGPADYFELGRKFLMYRPQ